MSLKAFLSFQNVLTLHQLMTQKLLNVAPFFGFFFPSSRFGVTLEAVFLLRFALINRRQREPSAAPAPVCSLRIVLAGGFVALRWRCR